MINFRRTASDSNSTTYPFISMACFLLICCLLLQSSAALAEDAALTAIFSQHQVSGTLVISSLNTRQTFIHNDVRAARRLPVASTFKIMNTLIALEEKAIAGKTDVLKWDGKQHEFPDWNHDQTLESAFKVSCVWCYQMLAHKVGAEKYLDYLHQCNYGGLKEPFETTRFWLDGALQISALEQVDFLKKVITRTLPFSTSSYETLRDIMLVEQTAHHTLRAKTGWARVANPQVGWYVGYVETANDVWIFAGNIDVNRDGDLPLRQQVTRAALKAKGVIE